MNKQISKNIKRDRRKARVRAKVSGTAEKPRLSVFKSNKGMYAQLIDDVRGITLASAHSREVKGAAGKADTSMEVGKLLAKKAQDKKIETIVFDKGSYKYHGRVKSLADGAREGGLKF